MARYFYGNSEIQGGGDGLQTLILMNPAFVGYSDSQPLPPQQQSPNLVFLNSNNSENALNLPHAPPSQSQHLIGIPLQGSNGDSQHQDASTFHGFLPRVQYNLYNPNTEMAAREGMHAQQGLSLSLSSQQPTLGYGSFLPARELAPPQSLVSPPRTADDRIPTGSPASQGGGVQNGATSVMLSSKYLKAAQELLDEVVNVGKRSAELCNGQQPTKIGESAMEAGGGADGGQGKAEGGVKRGSELSTAEKQEIQMKKAKLVNMLDEVEQMYKQYHHQMQIVISWFQQASGVGSAKTYTDLALQTISKQFRCLKDAILRQIQTASKNLGEEDTNLEAKAEGSRLKYVDNHIRQQKALQQLGMIQHNAWRPQRGLPERSVTVLRAWLFEHFLHPYPKDSDKVVLAKQTGLTRSQVSNWFINARVRLWKPMVEEMYMEEMKGVELTGSEDKTSRTTEQHQDSISKSTVTRAKSPMPENYNNAGFDLIGPAETESITQGSPKKPHNVDVLHSLPSTMIVSSNPANEDSHNSMKFTLMGTPTNFIGGFGSYPIGELERYETEQFQAPYSGNGVSLTLGLPHCDNLSMGGAHTAFLTTPTPTSNDFGGMNMNTPTSAHSANVYENSLMRDFVA